MRLSIYITVNVSSRSWCNIPVYYISVCWISIRCPVNRLKGFFVIKMSFDCKIILGRLKQYLRIIGWMEHSLGTFIGYIHRVNSLSAFIGLIHWVYWEKIHYCLKYCKFEFCNIIFRYSTWKCWQSMFNLIRQPQVCLASAWVLSLGNSLPLLCPV